MRNKVDQINELFSFAAPLDFARPLPYGKLASRLRLMTLFSNRLYIPMTFLLHNKEFHQLRMMDENEILSFLNDGRPIIAAPSTAFGDSFENHYIASRDSAQPALISEKDGGLGYAKFLDKAFPPSQLVEFGQAKRIRTFTDSFRKEATLLIDSKKLQINPVEIAIEEAEDYMQTEPLHNERVKIDKYSGLTRASLLSYLDCPERQSQVVRRSVPYLREAACLAYADNVANEFSQKYQMVVTPIVHPSQTLGTTEYVIQTVDDLVDELLSRPPFTTGGYSIDFGNLHLVSWKDLIEVHLNSEEAKKYFQCKKNICLDGGGTPENLKDLAKALHHYLSYLSHAIPPSGSRIGIALRRLCSSPTFITGAGSVTLAVVMSKGLAEAGISQKIHDIVPGLQAYILETLEILASGLLVDRVMKNRARYAKHEGVKFAFSVIARRRPITSAT